MLSVKSKQRPNVCNLENDGCRMDFCDLNHIHTKTLDDVFWLLGEKHSMRAFNSKNYFLLEARDVAFYGFKGFWVDCYIELSATVQWGVAYDFNYKKRKGYHLVFFLCNFFLDFWVISSKLFFRNFILLFANIFYKSTQFCIILYWHVDVYGKKTHECDHEFLFKSVFENLWFYYWKFKFSPGEVIFVKCEFIFGVDVMISCVDVCSILFEGIKTEASLVFINW